MRESGLRAEVEQERLGLQRTSAALLRALVDQSATVIGVKMQLEEARGSVVTMSKQRAEAAQLQETLQAELTELFFFLRRHSLYIYTPPLLLLLLASWLVGFWSLISCAIDTRFQRRRLTLHHLR